MQKPRGTLTGNQYRILLAIWEAGPEGLTVGEIWRAVGGEGNVTRTTVLNQVDRLAKRGWLKRRRAEEPFRYTVPLERQEVDRRLAAGFLGDYFGSSPLQAFQSLLRAGACDEDELRRLRELVDEALSDSESGEGA